MAAKELPSLEILHKVFRYDAECGKLYWRERPVEMFSGQGKLSSVEVCRRWNTRFAGKEAGSPGSCYRSVGLAGGVWAIHRIIYAIYHNEQLSTDAEIDHINQDKMDNRISNLRKATAAENKRNRTPTERKRIVYGVYLTPSGRWGARIYVDKRVVHLGTHPTKDGAVAARKAAEQKYFGEFAANPGLVSR
jgi:hypothetical protein